MFYPCLYSYRWHCPYSEIRFEHTQGNSDINMTATSIRLGYTYEKSYNAETDGKEGSKFSYEIDFF